MLYYIHVMSYNFLCHVVSVCFLGLYECLLDANHSENAGQDSKGDTANFTSPSNGGSPNSSLPANQHQRVPSTRAVPPAVAGQASPRPSTVAPLLTPWHLLSSLSLICLLLFLLFG